MRSHVVIDIKLIKPSSTSITEFQGAYNGMYIQLLPKTEEKE